MSGELSLVEAARAGKLDRVNTLLAEGAEVDGPDEGGTTALYAASVAGQTEVVRALLEAGADPDRPSLGDSDGLPLCGAACWGHEETVTALLEGGADADRTEPRGWTALKWAASGGHTGTVARLLEAGADPNLAVRTPPLYLAASRGAVGVVRLLLSRGADPVGATEEGETALEAALRWAGVDIEAELRAQKKEVYSEPGYEVVVTRREEDDGTELITALAGRGGEFDVTGSELQTGHGAIATLLERTLGIPTPIEELVARAMEFRYLRPTAADVRRHVTERPAWEETVWTLAERDDEDSVREVIDLTEHPDPLYRTLGVDVLARLSPHFRTLPRLRRMARQEEDPILLRSLVRALSDHGDAAALPELLRHSRHPDDRVRNAVARALVKVLPPEHPMDVGELIRLTGDEHEYVRDWATMSLGLMDADTEDLRDALAGRMDDPSPVVIAEAVRGLAERGDRRAVPGIRRLLTDPTLENYPLDVALEAVVRLGDPALRRDVLACRPLAESHGLHTEWQQALHSTSGG
ncbi:ankyrin repeat domain-containing protein [Actinocorallia sp. B10E7]|uniref:ankyrin repeat domain-containing protein n=1 Tax=Actinocorallia sp. B10E7 TaxID=3153558 RepID=UPI00325E4D1A